MGLRSDLSGIIPDESLIFLPDGYEIIGTIAIISIPPLLMPYQDAITKAILARRPSLETILNKVGTIKGQYRTGSFSPLFGKQTITEHKEYGFKYKMDIREVYFSTKLASERIRIANLISPGESVYVPFAGVGPYAIPIAARRVDVIAIEISQPACTWMKLNASRNKVSSHLQIIRGDALEASQYLKRKFSRIIIPTPFGIMKSPDIFLSMLSDHGIAHWITFCNENEITDHIQDLSHQGYHVMRHHRCGNIAPSISRWMLDIRK